jgi:hypothetical protein
MVANVDVKLCVVKFLADRVVRRRHRLARLFFRFLFATGALELNCRIVPTGSIPQHPFGAFKDIIVAVVDLARSYHYQGRSVPRSRSIDGNASRMMIPGSHPRAGSVGCFRSNPHGSSAAAGNVVASGGLFGGVRFNVRRRRIFSRPQLDPVKGISRRMPLSSQ